MGITQSRTTKCVLETPRGALTGTEYWDRTNKPVCQRYTRVPYAQPPIGQLRWRRPQSLPVSFSYNGSNGKPGDYTTFGPIAPQPVYGYDTILLENENAAPELENLQKEDCLYLNIWRPAGPSPAQGWPVQFFVHGGWLQVGDAMQNHEEDPFDLLSTTKSPRIIISATYRLNLFGFLASAALSDLAEDPAPGNYGFWDQRAALEWAAANIAHFGGDPKNITVGGLSAGAYSTLFQLYYDTYLPPQQRLIKRVFMYSNAVGVQPKMVNSESNEAQFAELCKVLSVPEDLSPAEKIAALRKFHSTDLIEVIPKLKYHTFRASTDNSFIPSTFLQSIHDGSFATRLAQNGIKILLGDVADEGLLYRLVNPPVDRASLRIQLHNYYPEPAVETLMKHYPLPSESASANSWADIYGKITGDCQVHATVRGFAHSLLSPLAGSTALPISSVLSGFRAGFTDDDMARTQAWLEPFGEYIAGKDVEWGTKNEREIRELGPQGEIGIVQDEGWDEGLATWNVLRDAQL